MNKKLQSSLDNKKDVAIIPSYNVNVNNNTVSIKIVNKSTNPLPEYTHPTDAGMDLRAYCIDDNFIADGADWDEVSQCVRIFSGGRALIHTGLYIKLPQGYEAQIRPRSGLALKQGITVLNTPGTIDENYIGEIGIILFNTSNEPFEVRTGDRIAQMVINKVEHFPLVSVDTLEDTDRGATGFGYSGVK